MTTTALKGVPSVVPRDIDEDVRLAALTNIADRLRYTITLTAKFLLSSSSALGKRCCVRMSRDRVICIPPPVPGHQSIHLTLAYRHHLASFLDQRPFQRAESLSLVWLLS